MSPSQSSKVPIRSRTPTENVFQYLGRGRADTFSKEFWVCFSWIRVLSRSWIVRVPAPVGSRG